MSIKKAVENYEFVSWEEHPPKWLSQAFEYLRAGFFKRLWLRWKWRK